MQGNDWHVSPKTWIVLNLWLAMEYEMILMRQLEAKGYAFRARMSCAMVDTPRRLMCSLPPIEVRSRIVNWIDSRQCLEIQ